MIIKECVELSFENWMSLLQEKKENNKFDVKILMWMKTIWV